MKPPEDALAVDRLRVLAVEVLAADLDGVDAELLRHLVELALEGEARLHRAVAPLRTARRLVGEDAWSRSGTTGSQAGEELEAE